MLGKEYWLVYMFYIILERRNFFLFHRIERPLIRQSRLARWTIFSCSGMARWKMKRFFFMHFGEKMWFLLIDRIGFPLTTLLDDYVFFSFVDWEFPLGGVKPNCVFSITFPTTFYQLGRRYTWGLVASKSSAKKLDIFYYQFDL
jgi:hypothetical protein